MSSRISQGMTRTEALALLLYRPKCCKSRMKNDER